MADRILWAELADPADAVRAAATAAVWPEPTYMYLERAPVAWLDESEIAAGVRLERLDPAADFAQYERGRVFCAERELRWERVDGSFRAVMVGDAHPFAPFAPAPELDLSTAQTETRRYFLWGLRIEDSDLAVVGVQRAGRGEPYLEMRVPRVLRYPVPGAKRRTRLIVCEYIDPQTGGVIYSRLTGVEEA